MFFFSRWKDVGNKVRDGDKVKGRVLGGKVIVDSGDNRRMALLSEVVDVFRKHIFSWGHLEAVTGRDNKISARGQILAWDNDKDKQEAFGGGLLQFKRPAKQVREC